MCIDVAFLMPVRTKSTGLYLRTRVELKLKLLIIQNTVKIKSFEVEVTDEISVLLLTFLKEKHSSETVVIPIKISTRNYLIRTGLHLQTISSHDSA